MKNRAWLWVVLLGGILLGELWALLDPDLPTLTEWVTANVPWWAALLFGLWVAWHFGIRYARSSRGLLNKQTKEQRWAWVTPATSSVTGTSNLNIWEPIKVEAAAMPRAVIVTVSVRDESGGMSAPGTAEILINEAPVIDQIIVSPSIVAPGGQATVTVLARDPEGEALTYQASVSEGSIVQGSAENEFIFTAPA